MSLLYRRALAAIGGLEAGASSAGGERTGGEWSVRRGDEGLVGWCLSVASWILSARKARLVDGAGVANPFPRPPESLGLEEAVAGGAAVVGIVRRPQDHNGIVDDVVNVVQPVSDTSVDISAGCALAAFLSSLLDGWDMEAAMAQSLFVARRGETFGAKKGPSVVDALHTVLGRIHAGERRVFPDGARGGDGLERHEVIPTAIGLAYVHQDARRAIAQAAGLAEHRLLVAAVSAMLCAAHDPDSLPGEWATGATGGQGGLRDALEGLLEIRAARYRRMPRPLAARFRRKKC